MIGLVNKMFKRTTYNHKKSVAILLSPKTLKGYGKNKFGVHVYVVFRFAFICPRFLVIWYPPNFFYFKRLEGVLLGAEIELIIRITGNKHSH